MINISKIIKCIAISGLLLSASVKTVSAFGFLPPMPGEPVNDPLTNVNKMFAYGQDVNNWVQTNLSQIKTFNLQNLKGFEGFVKGLGNKESSADKREKLKVPGLGKFVGFNAGGVSVDAGSTNEQDYQDMYYALFFTYPAAEDGNGTKYDVLKTAYRHKAKEYKQDTVVNTYVTGRYTEDYLDKIDETLTRLDLCIQGKKEGDECQFFGMQVTKPTTSEEGAEVPQEGDNGQLGVAMNAYVVTTIYDRILRIVEDLTATEAIFRAAQQIDVASPVSDEGSNESNAAEYLDNGLRFAYNNSHDNTHAVSLISKTKYSNKCKGNAKGNCPQINDDVADLESVKDTSVLKDLQYIDAEVNRIVGLHNLKSSFHEYKTQYRQYLMLKKIHEKAFNVLKESDNCAITFLNKHLPQNTGGSGVWYGADGMTEDLRNQYDKRKGLSGWLIDRYNRKSTQVTIGTSSKCDGYYEVCPTGYSIDESQEPCEDNGTKYFACGVEMVTQDASEAQNVDKDTVATNWKDTDGFVNGADSETIQQEGRRQAELTWDIGRDGVMKSMSDYGIQFDLWNDQKVLQAEYLRQKYRNMRLIIESADIGKLSYDIGTVKADNDDMPDSVGMASLVKHISLCQSLDKAVASARQKYCSGYSSSNCTVEVSNGNIVTKRYVIKNGKKELMPGYPKIESQKVSTNDSCTYKNEAMSLADMENKINNSNFCVTPSCLVKNFYPAVLGADSNTFANHEKRITAKNYFVDVIQTRKDEELKLLQWITQKVTNVDTLKQRLTAQKSALVNINKDIDKARIEKNKFNDELSRANERLKTISMEKAEFNTRKKQLNTSNIDKKVIDQKLALLDDEEKCINGKKTECSAYIKNTPDDTKLYMQLAGAENGMKKEEIKIKSYQSRLDGYKEDIEKLEKQIQEETNNFAGEYITRAGKMQENIEAANDIFENFMEDKEGHANSYRMKTKQKEICYKPKPLGLGCKKNGKDHERLTSENVATTLQKVIYYEGSLDKAIKKGLNDKFFSVANKANMTTLFSNLGVPTNFYVDNTFAATAVKLAAGNIQMNTLIDTVKDTLINLAAPKIENIITDSDNAAAEEIKAAKEKIKEHTDQYSLSGIDPNEAPSSDIYNSSKYNELREKHLALLENLRKPSQSETLEAGITDLSAIFGIPTKDELIEMLEAEPDISDEKIYDSVYFVGLPARGNTYQGITDDDKNAGRDFMPPKSPMIGLPPLREVFYFSTEEYNDIPQVGGKPVLSHLLNGKYCNENNICEEEYLPEVWLHLLASPNMRGDRRYQQTFVERSFARENINKLVKNLISNMAVPGASPKHYQTIISRAGIYPCKTDNNMIIDIDSDGNKVTNMEFMKRNAAPTGVVLPRCKEVATRIGNACNGKSGQLCHLLADHGINDIKDTQDLKKVSAKPMYEKYSELGQLLKEDLAYNPVQEEIQKYLQADDTNKLKNDITRQKAERASFKRNVMGSFLKATIEEDKAKKALEQNKTDLEKRIESLCTQIHEVGIYLDGDKITEKRFANSGDLPEDDCANILMNKGLATSVDDNDYDVDCQNITDDTYYGQIFCKLDNVKDTRLSLAKDKLNQKAGTIGKVEEAPLVVKEQWEEINNLIQAMEKDNKEYTEILPDTNSSDMKIEEAKTNRTLVIKKAEEGLKSMENQTQSAAYCPLY